MPRRKAQTAKAQVAVVDAKRDFDRKTELFARELIAQERPRHRRRPPTTPPWRRSTSAKAHEQALDSAIQSATAQLRVAQAMLVSARARVDQKNAGLKQAQVDLDHTTILAPVDGVVVSRASRRRPDRRGEPAGADPVHDRPGPDEDAGRDERGRGGHRPASSSTIARRFTVDAFPGETFTGTVTQIRKAPQVVQNVVTYTVIVGVENPVRQADARA